MAEEKSKKPKIDLKARLGKTVHGVAAPGFAPPAPGPIGTGSQPPPAASADGTPVPIAPPPVSLKPLGIAPPPGIGGGISLPSFGPRPAPQPKAPKPSAEQQTIKVEVSEEIEAQRKQSRRNVGIAGLLAAIVGLAIGFVAGGRNESTSRSSRAVKGAGALQADVKTEIGRAHV